MIHALKSFADWIAMIIIEWKARTGFKVADAFWASWSWALRIEKTAAEQCIFDLHSLLTFGKTNELEAKNCICRPKWMNVRRSDRFGLGRSDGQSDFDCVARSRVSAWISDHVGKLSNPAMSHKMNRFTRIGNLRLAQWSSRRIVCSGWPCTFLPEWSSAGSLAGSEKLSTKTRTHKFAKTHCESEANLCTGHRRRLDPRFFDSDDHQSAIRRDWFSCYEPVAARCHLWKNVFGKHWCWFCLHHSIPFDAQSLSMQFVKSVNVISQFSWLISTNVTKSICLCQTHFVSAVFSSLCEFHRYHAERRLIR